jgi:hypothetical protein
MRTLVIWLHLLATAGRQHKAALLAAMLTLGVVAYGQTSRGTVTGTVRDQTGAAIVAARVTLTGVDTGVRLSTVSNDAGIYRFDAVDPGVYELQVTHPGFRAYFANGISVAANRVTTLDPRLEVGAAETRIEVNGESSELLIKDSPLRGGNFQTREVRDLPLLSLNPVSLARILPGATDAAGSQVWSNSGNSGAGFSINGQRPRGNNYMLDGTENNAAYTSGEDQVFAIADAVEEVSVQTGNFGVEFGRAGGGVFNVVTKSGTNSLHGTLLWRYQSQRFDSISNLNRLMGVPQSVFSNNIYGFTVGGPVRKDKTFFFAGFQQNNRHSTANYPLQVPTADAVSRLRSLFSNNPRLDLYLTALGDFRGSGAPFQLQLGLDPTTGIDRGPVQFATGAYVLPARTDGPQWLVRVDHYQSEAHRLSWRYSRDSQIVFPAALAGAVAFPGFVQQSTYHHQNFLFADSYTFSPTYTNEFRFSYTRPDSRSNVPWQGNAPLALTLPKINFPNSITSPGLPSSNTQFLYGNNFIFQETQTKLHGRHAFRYGVELLRQTTTEARAASDLGTISFTNAVGYSAFANFLDDFSGPSASTMRAFGVSVFHPTQLRQTYFFQDNWKLTPTLALTLGLRYENFGQPANILPYPAFSGFDPAQFLVRHEIKPDNKDFGPAFGLAWSPRGGKTVLRGGYQINYDAFFAQAIFLGPAQATPNAVTRSINSANTGRGSPNWLEQLPTTGGAPSLSDARQTFAPDFRSPYTERWSFGFERQLPDNVLLDVSYIGNESHKLATKDDFNPLLPTGKRLYPVFGPATARTSVGNSAYHSLQARMDRRFSRGFQLSAAYTWSKFLDSTSDGIGSIEYQSPGANALSVPAALGGLKIDRGLSDFDRAHRLTIAYLWTIPGPRSGWRKYPLGGWALGGITTFQSGTPFTVANGSNRNGVGTKADRPDIGNAGAPLTSRALIAPRCATGYQNADTGACVSPNDVHWIEGAGNPNAATVGRNTLRTGGTNNFDLNLSKSIPLGEKRRLELRWEALNAFNHPQFIQVPQTSVNGAPAGWFLNRDFTDSGIRSMWVQVKLLF